MTEIDRLDDVAVHTEIVGHQHVTLFLRRSQHHDGSMFGSFIALDASQYFNAVDLRQFQIKEYYFWTMLDLAVGECACSEDEIKRLGAVFNDEYFACEVLLLQGSQRQ